MIDEAIEFYLMKIIKEINIYQFFMWLYQSKSIYISENDYSKLYIIMKHVVFNSTIDDIKEMIGMDEVCIK